MEIASWPENQICLLFNCQSARNLERRYDVFKLVLTSGAIFVFFTEDWLSGEVNNSEIFPGFCNQFLSRSDREVREYGGVLIASRSNWDLEALDLTIETFSFCRCSAIIWEELHHFSLMSTYLQWQRRRRIYWNINHCNFF